MIARSRSTGHLLVAVTAALLGVACGHPAPVVSAGDSTPAELRPDDPFARLDDRTPVAAYEFGSCTTDAQCATSLCGGATCAPVWESGGVCQTSRVQECLASVDDGQCGCVEGYCRWARSAPVMQCAQGDERAGTRSFRGAPARELYPVRISD